MHLGESDTRQMAESSPPEDAKIIAKLCMQLSASSLTTRLRALSGVGDCLIDAARLELKTPPLLRLVRTLVGTLLDVHCSQVYEKTWRLALQSLLVRAASLPDLPFSVAECALEVMQVRRNRLTSDTSRAGVMDVCLAMLPTLAQDGDKGLQRGLQALLAEQALLLEDARLGRAQLRKTANLFAAAPGSYAAFAAVCLAEQGQGLAFVVAAELFPLLYTALPEAERAAVRMQLLEAIVRRVVQAKAPQMLPAVALRKLGAFLQLLTAEEWGVGQEDSLEGNLLKTIKKAPEGSSLLAAAVASQMAVDLSAFSQAGAAATALRMLRSQALDVRVNGRTLLRHLACKSPQPDASAQLVNLAIETLQGKGSGGALTQLWQRAEMANAFAAIADALSLGSRTHVAQLASGVVLPALLAAVEKESIDDIRALLASAAGKWLAFLDAELPASIADLLRAGLTKVKSQAYQLALVQAVASNSEVREQLVPVVLSLCAAAAKKPTAATHVDALLSYRLVAECCPLSGELAAAAETHKLWAALPLDGCFLFNRALHTPAAQPAAVAETEESKTSAFVDAGAAPYRDGGAVFVSLVAQSQLAVAAIAVQQQLSPAFASGELPRGAVECVLSCSLHSDASIRKAAAATVAALAGSNPRALKSLLQAMLGKFCAATAESEALERARALDFKAASARDDASSPRDSGRLPAASWAAEAVHALCVASPGPQAKPESLFPLALLLCSHPLVNGGALTTAASLWVRARAAFGLDGGPSGGADLAQRVVQAAQSDSTAERGAGQTAMVLLALRSGAWGQALMREHVLPALLAALGGERLAAVSAEDVTAYLNPQAALAAAAAAQSEVAVDLRITNADRKGKRGAFGADFVEVRLEMFSSAFYFCLLFFYLFPLLTQLPSSCPAG